MASAVKWELLEWFGDINGVKNASEGYAEDVMIFAGDGTLLADLIEVAPQSSVDLSVDSSEISIAWRDSAGMHADVIRLEGS